MLTPPVSTLLFDLDGTLTDSRRGICACMEYALGRLGRPVPETLVECIGPPLHQSFRRLVGDELVPAAVEFYRERFGTIGLFENEVYPGVPQALSSLVASGHTLRVVTSKPAVFARRIIEHFELDSYFDSLHGSELDGSLADKTELLEHVLRTEQINPQHAMMLGDRSHDIIGARNNGVRAAGALWGYGSQSELRAAGADELHKDVAAFAAVVLQRAPASATSE